MEVKDWLFLIGLFLSLIGSGYAAWPQVRNARALRENTITDSAENLATAAKTLVEPLENRIIKLEKERAEWQAERAQIMELVHKQEQELRLWRNYAARLIKQLMEAAPDVTPIPFDTDPKIKGIPWNKS